MKAATAAELALPTESGKSPVCASAAITAFWFAAVELQSVFCVTSVETLDTPRLFSSGPSARFPVPSGFPRVAVFAPSTVVTLVKAFTAQYEGLWQRLDGNDHAVETTVGGDFATVGKLEFELLRSLGLRTSDSLIDVGCGSGRLAVQLAPWLKGSYLGTDILHPLLDHAQRICQRPDWRFECTTGETIPAPDGGADMVCFFSVLTHITHEDTWRYLLESKRVLKPGGRIVCSFLEFRIRGHWAIFRDDLRDPSPNKVLNQFLSRDAFEAFALNAGLEVEQFFNGDKPHIPIDEDLTFKNGRKLTGLGSLGQSVCVLSKPWADLPAPA